MPTGDQQYPRTSNALSSADPGVCQPGAVLIQIHGGVRRRWIPDARRCRVVSCWCEQAGDEHTVAFWKLLGEGTLYEEFRIVNARLGVQSGRAVDGLVVLGEPPRMAARRERRFLDGEDVVVIQTEATCLNPAVFGQALLSPELIRLRWAPHSVRSVLLCTADDPGLRPYVDAFPQVETRVVEPRRDRGFPMERAKGAAQHVADRFGGALIAPAFLSRRFTIDGIVVPDVPDSSGRPLPDLVAGRDVITVHSTPGGPCMYRAGELVLAPPILTAMGAASVRSILLCGRRDQVIETALRRYVEVDVQPLPAV
jgi:hypothetical protein